MLDYEILREVKTALCITGDFHDDMLKIYINECKEFLKSSGVSEELLNSKAVVGVICRGVTDLWSYGAGDGKFSEYFIQRAIQLSYEEDKCSV